MNKGITLGGIVAVAFMFYWITQVFSDAMYILNLQNVSEMAYRLSGVFALIFIVASFLYAIKTKNWALIILFVILVGLIILGWFRWF